MERENDNEIEYLSLITRAHEYQYQKDNPLKSPPTKRKSPLPKRNSIVPILNAKPTLVPPKKMINGVRKTQIVLHV